MNGKKIINNKIIVLDVICFIILFIISLNTNVYNDYLIFINIFLFFAILGSIFFLICLYIYDRNKFNVKIKIVINTIFISIISFIMFNRLYINKNILINMPFLNEISFVNVMIILFIISVLCIVFYFVYLIINNKTIQFHSYDQAPFVDEHFQRSQELKNCEEIHLNDIQNLKNTSIASHIVILISIILLAIIFIVAVQLKWISDEMNYVTYFLNFIFFGVLIICTIAIIFISILCVIKFVIYFNENIKISKDFRIESNNLNFNNVFGFFFSFILMIILYYSKVRKMSIDFLNTVFDNQDIALLLLIPFTILLFFVCANVILKILSKPNIDKVSDSAEKILKIVFEIVESTILELLEIARFVPNMLDIFKADDIEDESNNE